MTATPDLPPDLPAGRPGPPPVRTLPDARPPSVSWQPSVAAPPDTRQPALHLGADLDRSAIDERGPSLRRRRAVATPGVRIARPPGPWNLQPDPALPDAGEWASGLALAVAQAILGQRPATQLTRWMAEEVLDSLGLRQRRRPPTAVGRSVTPVVLRSVRYQHPAAAVAEVAAHLSVGRASVAMAFRLEAFEERWVCTALDVGSAGGGTSGMAGRQAG